MKIRWYYHRRSWTSCKRAQEFLGPKNIDLPEYVIANKIKFGRDEALALARQAEQVWVSKGKKLLKLDLADTTDDEIAGLILGRSGTLRAPAIWADDTFVVGFHAEGYTELFG
jgi:arsenate reductase-like glutaredoxin family protein